MSDQRLFISHASEDAAIAERIVAYLEARGVPCWISSRDIPPRAIYADAIVEGIQNCDACAVLVSAASNASKAVKREVEVASHEDKAFIPIRIHESEPAAGLAYYLRNAQWVEYGREGERALDRITPGAVSAKQESESVVGAWTGPFHHAIRSAPEEWVIVFEANGECHSHNGTGQGHGLWEQRGHDIVFGFSAVSRDSDWTAHIRGNRLAGECRHGEKRLSWFEFRRLDGQLVQEKVRELTERRRSAGERRQAFARRQREADDQEYRRKYISHAPPAVADPETAPKPNVSWLHWITAILILAALAIAYQDMN